MSLELDKVGMLSERELKLIKESFEANIRELNQFAKVQNWLPSELAAAKADVIMLAHKFSINL